MKLIPLTQGQVALVDDCDFEWLNQFKWYAQWQKDTKSFYASRAAHNPDGRQTTIGMHRVIMNAPGGQHVDHGNHNTLDNRRDNLRLTTHQGNHMNKLMRSDNTSGFCGVHWDKRGKKWHASIRINRKLVYIGGYVDKSDAIAARQAANIKYGFHDNHGKVFA